MIHAQLQRFDLADPVHGRVPCAALRPADAAGELPVCLFLYGGGGSRESLADMREPLESWWGQGLLPPMLLVTPDVGPWSFYLDDPARGFGWESFVRERLVPHVQALASDARRQAAIALVGMSMGGYGALKLAFAKPAAFRAVAAISPMIEPSCEANDVRPRNRYHYPPEVPQALLGAERDAALYARDQPAARARANADELLTSGLAIYLDAAGDDALHAHDGAEYLHRLLWELDVAHEYHLRRDSDHAGPDLVSRLETAFHWVGSRLSPPTAAPYSELEAAWLAWIANPASSPPEAPLTPASPVFPRWLRALLAPARAAAEARDTTFARRYGLL